MLTTVAAARPASNCQHGGEPLQVCYTACTVTDVLASPVLVLNRYFQPVQLTTVRRAVVLLYGGAAHAVDEHGEEYDFAAWRATSAPVGEPGIPLARGTLRVPRLVHLLRYDRVPRNVVRLTRENLMTRDGHACQYCGKQPTLRELNIDHVLPRSRGGRDSWENLVTSCMPCNLRKGWRTPEEANMHLQRRPLQPKWSFVAQILRGETRRFPEWNPYLKSAS